jgi:hypothetical protein
VKLLDSLVVLALFCAAVQLAYCFAVGTFPFNSFLSGFLAAVGTTVLTSAPRVEGRRFRGRARRRKLSFVGHIRWDAAASRRAGRSLMIALARASLARCKLVGYLDG